MHTIKPLKTFAIQILCNSTAIIFIKPNTLIKPCTQYDQCDNIISTNSEGSRMKPKSIISLLLYTLYTKLRLTGIYFGQAHAKNADQQCPLSDHFSAPPVFSVRIPSFDIPHSAATPCMVLLIDLLILPVLLHKPCVL